MGCFGDRVVATCMAGYDGHRGWIYYLGVDPAYQKKGLAARMVGEAEALLKSLGCPKVNLMVRETNSSVMEFYQHQGYAPDGVKVMGKRLDTDPE